LKPWGERIGTFQKKKETRRDLAQGGAREGPRGRSACFSAGFECAAVSFGLKGIMFFPL